MSHPAVDRIRELLSEPLPAARARTASAFDALAGGADRPIVLYGAGGMGRRTIDGLRKVGRPPIALSDRNPALHGTEVSGLRVLAPTEAIARFGSEAVFVVSIWNGENDFRYHDIRGTLQTLGAKTVAPAIALYWKHPEAFLPHYCLGVPLQALEAREDILSLAGSLADELSVDVLHRQLAWRLQMDFESLPVPVPGIMYFRSEFFRFRPDEFLVDCGAFDGDSLHHYLRMTAGTKAQALAIEPDPGTYRRLLDWLARQPPADRARVETREIAVGVRRERLRFNANGLASAGVSATGDVEVECAPLDELLDGRTPTFIKMDVEGAEMDALLGGARVVASTGPSLAVCVYHRPDHLWTVPLQLRRMLPRHRVYLRPHGYEGWDLVCYAVAPDRS